MLQAHLAPTILGGGKEVGVEVGAGVGVEQVGKGRAGKGRGGKGRVGKARVEVVTRAPHSGCSTCHLGRSHLQLCGSADVDVQPAGVQVSTTWVATDDTKPSSKSVRWCLVPSAEGAILAGNGPCYGVPA
jgi:hypothetical protein